MKLSRKHCRSRCRRASLAVAVLSFAGLAVPASADPAPATAALAQPSQSAASGHQSRRSSTPAPAPAPAESNVVAVRVCNRTGDNALVAISYQPLNSTGFHNRGWFPVRANACSDLVNTTNAYFYGYAEVENRRSDAWTGNHSLCVQYPGPYAFWSSPSTTTCDPGQQLRNFVVLHANGWGTFTWNLNP